MGSLCDKCRMYRIPVEIFNSLDTLDLKNIDAQQKEWTYDLFMLMNTIQIWKNTLGHLSSPLKYINLLLHNHSYDIEFHFRMLNHHITVIVHIVFSLSFFRNKQQIYV